MRKYSDEEIRDGKGDYDCPGNCSGVISMDHEPVDGELMSCPKCGEACRFDVHDIAIILNFADQPR